MTTKNKVDKIKSRDIWDKTRENIKDIEIIIKDEQECGKRSKESELETTPSKTD